MTPVRQSAQIRVGLIGYGLAGGCFHAPLIASTSGMRLAAAGGVLFDLGSRAAYTKSGKEVQEQALGSGARPGRSGWGREPREDWGQLGAGDVLEQVPAEAGAHPVFYSDLARALRDGAPPPVDPADAVAGLEIIEAARRSAAVGRSVQLPQAGAAAD